MAASSLNDNQSDFAKLAIPAMFADTGNIYRLEPLIFSLCNGGYSWSFSEAFIQYSKQSPTCFQYDFWYKFAYDKLVNVLSGKTENIEKDDRPYFHCLFDFVNGDHVPCLQSLGKEDNLTELKVATTMANHYFKPLIPDGTYVIDKSYPASSGHAKCALCKEEIVYGDTSIGNNMVWHGKVDILLDRSIVKVNLAKEMENLTLEDSDGDSSCEEESCSDEDIDHSSLGTVEVKMLKNWKKSQLLAEVIVNAFYNSCKRTTLHSQFLPSFLVTEKYIRVVLYNVELDILLVSPKLPIWQNKKKGELDVMTLIRVWLAINYSDTLDKNREMYQVFLRYTHVSNFKTLVSKAEDSYAIYLNDMQQPLKPGKSDSHTHSNISCPDSYFIETQKLDLQCALKRNELLTTLENKLERLTCSNGVMHNS